MQSDKPPVVKLPKGVKVPPTVLAKMDADIERSGADFTRAAATPPVSTQVEPAVVEHAVVESAPLVPAVVAAAQPELSVVAPTQAEQRVRAPVQAGQGRVAKPVAVPAGRLEQKGLRTCRLQVLMGEQTLEAIQALSAELDRSDSYVGLMLIEEALRARRDKAK